MLGAVQREFQGRYQGSMLGGVWAVLNPLTMIIIYTLVFSQIMGLACQVTRIVLSLTAFTSARACCRGRCSPKSSHG